MQQMLESQQVDADETHVELHLISIPRKIFSQVGINLMSLTESEGFNEDGGYKYLISG